MKKDKMTPYLSDKLRVISFICIVLVVWIHTYYNEGIKFPTTRFLMTFWGEGICLWAVPLFYTISGYLFFLNTKENGIQSVFAKQKKRIRTLLIPYFIANIISITFYGSLKVACGLIPSIQDYINVNMLDNAQGDWFMRVYYYFWTGPIAFQMWFVRDLMVLVIFSPIIYYLLKSLSDNKWSSWIAIIGAIGVIYWHYNPFIWALGWYILGGICSMSMFIYIPNTKRIRSIGLLCLVAALLIILVNATCVLLNEELLINQSFVTLLGVPAVWILYDSIVKGNIISKRPTMDRLCTSTFFIYLFHEPFLNIFKKFPLIMSKSEWCINISYILSPIVFIALAIVLSHYLRKYLPKLYYIYTGGR